MQGIYQIKNKVNNKVYVGQSTDIRGRWEHHIRDLEVGRHQNHHLQNAWNKYGKDAFEFSIIEECSYEMLTEREQYWIDYYGGQNSFTTYNNRDAGIGGHLSEHAKRKISESLQGHTPWNKGHTATTDERVKRGVDKLRGIKLSDEVKQRTSDTVKRLHAEGKYNYAEMTRKRLATQKSNGTVRKDKGKLKGKMNELQCKRISEGKLRANELKRQQGLPLRNEIRPPTPMRDNICVVCGKVFQTRRCKPKKTCSAECRGKCISMVKRGEL